MAMFKSFYQSIVNKISQLNPIRNFIKYALDKTLNQFLSRQLTLDDFKNGPLNLSSLDLNVGRINSTSLVSSPYILHSGVIGKLKITLPPLSQISSKSIQVCISNLEISLKPNKQFYENFKKNLEELSQQNMFNVEQQQFKGQISENSPVDFFKQFLKSIIMNIKIKVQGIIVKLYMNTPTTIDRNPQYYIMLRIPSVKVDRQQEINQKKDSESFKFKIQIQQISVHLLRSDTQYPQYSNLSVKQSKFPFQYPPVSHPSTLILIGSQKIEESNIKKSTSFILTVMTDYEKKTRDFGLRLDISNFQCMINPLQIKILTRFLVQIKQFKQIYNNVIEQLGLRTSRNLSNDQLPLRKTLSKSGNIDIFSSMVMSVNEFLPFQGKKKKQQPDMLESLIMSHNEARKEVEQLYNHCTQQQKKTINQINQFTAIEFKTQVSVKIQLGDINIYVTKYIPQTQYVRGWTSFLADQSRINTTIGSDYFMVSINKSQLLIEDGGKTIQFSLKKAKVYNVKLISNRNHENVQFFDVQGSSQYYRPKQNLHTLSLINFQLQEGQHYCCEQIIRISQKSGSNYLKPNIKIYSFLPTNSQKENSLFEYGFDLRLDRINNQIKINILQVQLSFNQQIVKDIISIFYPVFAYKRLSKVIQLKLQALGAEGQLKKKNKSLFQSQYQYQREQTSEYESLKRKNQPTMSITISDIKFGFRESSNQTQFEEIIAKYKQKGTDSDHFSRQCFCKINKQAIYGQCMKIHIQKRQDLKLTLKKIILGLIQIDKSQVILTIPIVSLESQNEDTVKIFRIFGKQCVISVYLPKLGIKLEYELIRKIVCLIGKEVDIFLKIYEYFKYLKAQVGKIEMKINNLDKKMKKQNEPSLQLQIYIGYIHITIQKIVLIFKDLFFTNQNQQIMLKLSAMIFSLIRNKAVKLGNLKENQFNVSQYLQKANDDGILQSDIILLIGKDYRSEKRLQSKNKVNFFLTESQSRKNIVFSIRKKQAKSKQSNIKKNLKTDINFTSNFKFKNRPVSNIIEEERYSKVIEFYIDSPIFISTVNFIDILSIKNDVEILSTAFKKQSSVLNLIDSKSIILTERKQSSQLDSQQMELNIRLEKINIDIRPYYLQDSNQLIYSNTRSVLTLAKIFAEIKAYNDIGLNKIDCDIPQVKLLFLYHEDRETLLNPLIIQQKEYILLGFKPIIEMTCLKLRTKIDNNKIIIKESGIDNLAINLSIHGLSLFLIHLQYLIHHNVNKNYVWAKEQQQQYYQLKMQDYEEQSIAQQYYVEDLSQALGLYQKKIEEKKQDDVEFRNRPFKQKQILNSFLDLEFKVFNFCIKIYNGSDYIFKNPESINRVIEKKRERLQNTNLLKYFQISFQNLQLSLIAQKQQQNANIYTLISFNQCQISLSNCKSTQNFMRRLVGGKNYQEQVLFSIFRNQSQMKVILNMSSKKIELKSSKVKISLGFSSDILKFIEQLKEYQKINKNIGLKKNYNDNKIKEQQKKQDKKLLVHMPQFQIILSLQYNGLDLISSQTIKTKQLMIHEQISNKNKISKELTGWVNQLIFSNVGGIISGGMIKVLSSIFDQIIQVIRLILEKLFGK